MYAFDRLEFCQEIFRLYHIRLQLFAPPYENAAMIDFGLRRDLFGSYDYVSFLEQMQSVLRPGEIAFFKDQLGISYNVFSLRNGPEPCPYHFGVIGPWRRGDTPDDMLRKLAEKYTLSAEQSSTILSTLQRIPENIDRERWIILITRTIGRLITPDGNVGFFVPDSHYLDLPAFHPAAGKTVFSEDPATDMRLFEHLNSGFTHETMLLRSIRSGSYAKAIDYAHRYLNFQIHYRRSYSLSTASLFSEMNTLLRYAAQEAGVSAIRLDEVYVKYSHLAERSIRADNIPCSLMVRDYCDIVSKYSHTHSPVIASCIDYIDFFYNRPISLPELARQNSVSAPYLSTLFRSEVGMTFVDYLNETRIAHAKTYLLRADLSVQEIALRCGFNDASYFTRVFKKLTGQSPRTFRTTFLLNNTAE